MSERGVQINYRGGSIIVAAEEISPERANVYLAKNHPDNRRINKANVMKLANDMAYGRFPLTHEAIAFDTMGTLIDGQHRLSAIIKSGRTVLCLVVRGLEAEAFVAIGKGVKRTLADSMTINGEAFSPMHVKIARAMTPGGLDSQSDQEQRLFVVRHAAGVEFAAKLGSAKTRGIDRSNVLGVIARAFNSGVDAEKLSRFHKILVTGEYSGPHELAAIKLRNRILDPGATPIAKTEGGSNLRREFYFLVTTALKKFLAGEEVGTLKANDKEEFPLVESGSPATAAAA